MNLELHGLEETIRAIVREELEQLGNGSPWMDREAAARYLCLPISRLEKDAAKNGAHVIPVPPQ